VGTPNHTADGVMLFGKNSDRQRNEAQAVEFVPRQSYAANSQLKCTYITIPQVPSTNAVLLCRPFWIWGAEMGVNEHGVAIGNEGLRARSPAPQEEALTGMDLLRLSLERSISASEAVNVMISLLEKHGQGGNCGYLTPAYYNNGFLIADSMEAFVLETLDREWILERVRDMRAISNVYSIGRTAERVSSGLSNVIRSLGWSKEAEPDYAEAIADPSSQHIGHSLARRLRATSLMQSKSRRIGIADMMNILRDHGSYSQNVADYHPEKELERTICLHARGDDRPAQTVGSMISELRQKDSVHWVTGTSAPCMSIFKPVLLDVAMPSQGAHLAAHYDAQTLWWRHERLHRRAIFGEFGKFLETLGEERDLLEASFHKRVTAVLKGGGERDRTQVVAECWQEARATEERWMASLSDGKWSGDASYGDAWEKMNLTAGIDPS